VITVLGGGPAGAAASLLLARLGHPVQLVTKAGRDQRLAVSLPPSCAKVFDALGIAAAVDAAGFQRSTGNTAWWGSDQARVEYFADGARGWQLDVGRLADVILAEAIAAGVQVDRRMATDAPGGFVLDCTGRAGIVARARGVRRLDGGPRTIALIGEWRHSSGWAVADHTHTLIESYRDGWMWSLPVGDGVRHVAAMVDPQRSDLARAGSSTHVYLAEVRKTRIFSGLTAEATLQGGPWGWDATPYDATAYAGDDWLLVGDAGSFIDPLSSAGVKKALASGWLAAVTAHTCVKTPAMRTQALAFFDAREREIASHMRRESRQFLGSAASGHGRPFWSERAADLELESAASASLREAFEALKRSNGWSPRVGPGVGIAPRPCVRDSLIVLEPHVVTAEHPNGIRYVRGVDLVALLDLAPATRQVPEAYEIYLQRLGPTRLDDFLLAVATAVAGRWLVSE